MKTIYSKQNNFQIFLDALIFIYQLFFGILPDAETKPYIFVSPSEIRREASIRARLELKKQGGAR